MKGDGGGPFFPDGDVARKTKPPAASGFSLRANNSIVEKKKKPFFENPFEQTDRHRVLCDCFQVLHEHRDQSENVQPAEQYLARRRSFPLHSRENTVFYGDHHALLQVLRESFGLQVQKLRGRIETGSGMAFCDQTVPAGEQHHVPDDQERRIAAHRRTYKNFLP